MLSPGRVSADRTSTLKYRNPDLLAIVVSTRTSNLSIRLVSLDSGSEAGRIELPLSVDSSSPIGVSMIEDWIVCTFRTTSLEVPTHILVSTYLSQPAGSE
jgi:polygalacturonase